MPSWLGGVMQARALATRSATSLVSVPSWLGGVMQGGLKKDAPVTYNVSVPSWLGGVMQELLGMRFVGVTVCFSALLVGRGDAG